MERNRVAGIIAEYNPFHAGHAWMIRQLKEQGFETIVCVMSGAFVQRAEPALLPPHIRAEAAVRSGADLVLRLPTAWATASAEAFAEGGAGLLSALGCVDTLAFGAETADIEALQGVAALLQREEFAPALKEELSTGISFASARAAAAQKLQPGAGTLLASPNNILGIEYCKALQTAVPKALAEYPDLVLPVPYALPREGAGHDKPPKGGFASASWLRGQALGKSVLAMKGYVPAKCLDIYVHAASDGEFIDTGRWEVALLSRLRGITVEQFAACAGAGEGLGNRLYEAAQNETTLEGLYSAAKSKRFAHSRVRRLALTAALGIPDETPGLPPFAHVLAAGPKGHTLLKTMKDSAVLPVSTSLARLAQTGPRAAAAAQLEASAESLYALCQRTPRAGGRAFTQPASMQ